MKKTILITGGSGFIGRNLVENLATSFHILSPSSKELNLLSEDEVNSFFRENNIDIVIHAATHNATQVSNKDLSQVFQNNTRMYFHLVNNHKLFTRMFYFGSGAEFDKRFYKPLMNEGYFDRHVPEDPYGLSKYVMAKYIESVSNVYNLRIFGVFGKYEDWRIRFISNIICMAIFDMDIQIKQNMKLDYLYIDDFIQIVKQCIELEEIPYKDINICTGKPIELISIAKLVLTTSGKKLHINVREMGMNTEYSGDNTRLNSLINPIQFTRTEDAIMNLYYWYETHKSFINKADLHHY